MTFSGSVLFNNSFSLPPEDELQFAQLLINQAQDAAFCVGDNGEFLYINDVTCSMSQYSREELLFMSLQDIEVGLSTEVWLERWQRLKSERSLTFKSTYRTKRNRILGVEVNISYVEYQGIEFGCAFVRENYNDLREELSHYQKTEAELEASVSILRSTLECASNGILAVNFDGEILCYNQKFVDLWQLPKDIKVSRKSSQAKLYFDSKVKDPDLFTKAVWDKSSQCGSESYDLIELNDGRVFAHYSEPHQIGNKIIGRVWSIWDVTKFKRSEEALKLNESRFRSLAENTEASIFLVYGNKICYANPAATVLTGYEIKELLYNFSFDQLIKNRKYRRVKKQDGEVFGEYEEILVVTKSGAERWLACTVAVLSGAYDFTNEPVKLVTAIDITDYKYAESEVRQALEQAKKLSELRERFVSMLCHQFRTPLNVVSFSADLLRRNIHQWTEEKNRSYLDLIQAAVTQISQLVDDMLLYGKAQAAKLKCEPRLLNLNQFCRDVVAQLQFTSESKRIFSFVNDDDCDKVYLDPKFLHHILNNLLSNAIKYSPSESEITLKVSCQDESVIFQVKDAGIGIPVIDQQQIFELFSRGSNVDHITGTGIGLSIVKTLVDLHGGEICLESEVGVGTTFTVVLPSIQ